MPACPTTIAWAQRDRLLLAGRQAPRAARRLPQARHVTLRGCGHVPMWDDPEQVARAILDAHA
jgi:pimeloyl-ACP methyl ester carboxylesterase